MNAWVLLLSLSTDSLTASSGFALTLPEPRMTAVFCRREGTDMMDNDFRYVALYQTDQKARLLVDLDTLRVIVRLEPDDTPDCPEEP